LPPSFTLARPLFTGNRLPFPENRVNAPVDSPTLTFGRQNSDRPGELGMTRNQNSKHNFRSFVGSAMLIIGSAVLVAYSAAIAWEFHAALSSRGTDSLGLFGSFGLASLHAIRAVALDHAAVLSVVHHILILFFAFLVMLVGIALLPRRAAGVNAPGNRNLSAPPRGVQ
jgi:hypothetical protein